MTLVETTIGTPWELDTRDAILLARGPRNEAVASGSRADAFASKPANLMVFAVSCSAIFRIAGVRWQEARRCWMFATRILKPLGIPIVFGAPVGHTARPMLTVPLGVRARLRRDGNGIAGDSGGGGGMTAMSKAKHVHVIGIGGSAMSPLAGMLREAGISRDGIGFRRLSAGFDFAGELGISFFHQFDRASIWSRRRIWWWSAISSRAEIRNWKKCSTAKFRIVLCRRCWKRNFCRGKHSIVVSGTHGKTTTTAMLAWIFHVAGKRPNFLVGGVAENFGKSYGLGRRRGIYSRR